MKQIETILPFWWLCGLSKELSDTVCRHDHDVSRFVRICLEKRELTIGMDMDRGQAAREASPGIDADPSPDRQASTVRQADLDRLVVFRS